jgi:threonine synthase
VKPTGIAKSLNIGNPADGPYALDAIRRTGGAVGRVGDEEIVQGIRDLARTTGIFAETAGGVTVAVLRQLVADGRLDPAKETVVLNTGEGLKTLDPLTPVVGFTHRVEPSLRSVRAAGLIS